MDKLPNPDTVKEVARDLWMELDNLSLEVIDGTFYWKVCREQEITALRAAADNERLRDLIPASATPGFSWDRIPMRSAFTWGRMSTVSRPQSLDYVQIGVRDSTWRGADVERACFQCFDNASSLVRPAFIAETRADFFTEKLLQLLPLSSPEPFRQAIELSLWNEGEFNETLSWTSGEEDRELQDQAIRGLADEIISREIERTDASKMTDSQFQQWRSALITEALVKAVRSSVPAVPSHYGPFVMVTVTRPVPPPGVVAAYYDGIAIGRNQWNESLRGAKSRQNPITAIRTWTAGLLFGSGLSKAEAYEQASNCLEDTPYPDDSKRREDRKNLVRRVIEAKPFVYRVRANR